MVMLLLAVLQECKSGPDGNAAAVAAQEVQPPASTHSVDAALETELSKRLGVPAKLEGEHEKQIGLWTFVCGRPVQANGAPMDYAMTNLRDQAAEGMVDDNACALIERLGSGVSVRELSVGDTDAPFVDWPARHGAPAAILDIY